MDELECSRYNKILFDKGSVIYIVWYMNDRCSPEVELYKYKNIAVDRIKELIGKYDRIGISQELIAD